MLIMEFTCSALNIERRFMHSNEIVICHGGNGHDDIRKHSDREANLMSRQIVIMQLRARLKSPWVDDPAICILSKSEWLLSAIT